PVMSFQLLSNSFAEGGWIPELYSCKGANLSPSLEWSGEPGDVRSFALVVEDPDYRTQHRRMHIAQDLFKRKQHRRNRRLESSRQRCGAADRNQRFHTAQT